MDHRTEAGEERDPSLPVLSLLATAEVPLDCELRDQQRRQHPWFGAGMAGPCTPAAVSLLFHLLLQPSICSHHTCGLPLQQSHLCWPKGCETSLGHWESSLSLNTKTVPVQAVSQTSDPVTGPVAVIFLVLFCFSDLFDSDLFEHTANID